MDLVPTLVNALVVMLVGAVVTYVTRTQIRDLKQDLIETRRELKAEMAELRQEIRDLRVELRTEFRSEIASVRSDLTQIALAVGAQPRPQTG